MPQQKSQRKSKEVMERISLTIPKTLLADIDTHVAVFATGDLSNNRSKYICKILEQYTPSDSV